MDSKKYICVLVFLISTLLWLYLTNSPYQVFIRIQRDIFEPVEEPKHHESTLLPKVPKEQYGMRWIDEMEKKYQNERERIQKVCKKHDIPRQKLIDKKFIHILRNHKIALCTNAKVGSSTWRQHFTYLLPKNENKKHYGHWTSKDNFTITENDFTGGHNDWISTSVIKNFLRRNRFLSVSFVRHPFERLVSAYNDKIRERWIKKKGYQKWFENDTSFSSFVNLVLYQHQTSCNPSKPQITSSKSSNNNCESNLHWRPFVIRCSYCDINYDMIGRMETWNDDFNYIIRKRKLEKYFPVQKTDNRQYHATKQNTTEVTKDLFSNLSKKQKEDLYKMFRIDFEMFNYNPEIYL